MNADSWLPAALTRIKARYFRPTIAHPGGTLVHFGDCKTYRAMDVYKYAPCTCGLLHDLRPLPHALILQLHPKYEDDLARQEAMVPGAYYWLSAEDKAARDQAIDAEILRLFPPADKDDKRQADDETAYRGLVEAVFGSDFAKDRREGR